MLLRDICWGVIGTGAVCEVKSVPAMFVIPGSTVIGVTNRNQTKASDYANRFGIGKVCSTDEDLLADPEINTIYIATPPSSHLHYTRLAAQSGKAIYVEKPMALNYTECLEMIRLSKLYQVPLFVAYYRRAFPLFRAVKKMVQNEIGKVLSVEIRLIKAADLTFDTSSANWRVNPQISGGGYFVDLASHQLDLLDFIFGPLTVVNASATNQGGFYPAEDFVTAELITEQQIPVKGYWDFHSVTASPEDRIVISGTRGNLTFSTFGNWEILLEMKGAPPKWISYPETKNVQYYLIEEIIKELKGDGTACSNGISAARASRLMDLILYDYYH